ncbi:hypothetical protein GIB67_032900 [Kingdonia uniflora]|uniref:histidine kinase n=1 Tax=Kingdonia uniflora TaxID=39325 RepID=A0A7J7P5V1_9MAGN|nr:hypothetical protein GIB67_032900 [Kingdonia uniflora]
MVLMLPTVSERQWHVHELELIEVVADQVAVALSHAAILEESIRARDHLAEQNVALDLARREPETTIRARNDFLAVMNHEMRTPMHAIIALYSLLQETELTAEQCLMVETVLKSTNLLATLINDVLDLSRLEDRSLELDLRAFNLHSVFREVINLIKPIASVKKLFLSLNLAPNLPEYVVGDEKLLMQTILNVVGNAVKFSKEGSISISVKDSGSGINPQDIPKLFNKFADRQSLASKNSCGKGLGLAISKRFLSLMEGHIWIESEGLGKGCIATFLVKLGIAERPKMAMKGLLVHLGCDVTEVGSSEVCLRIFSHEHKVVFTDVGISGMDGYEVVSVLQDRFSARHQRPLITALTANTDRAMNDNCLRVGMDGVVLKPVSLGKMRSILSVLLQNGTLHKMSIINSNSNYYDSFELENSIEDQSDNKTNNREEPKFEDLYSQLVSHLEKLKNEKDAFIVKLDIYEKEKHTAVEKLKLTKTELDKLKLDLTSTK